MRRNTLLGFATGCAVAASLTAAPATAGLLASAPGSATSPTVSIGMPQFSVGSAISAGAYYCADAPFTYVPMKLTWTATPGSSPIAAYDVYLDDYSAEDGTYKILWVQNTTQQSLGTTGSNYNNECGGQTVPPAFEVVAKTVLDGRWGATASVWSGRFLPGVWQENGAAGPNAGDPLTVTRAGTWSTSNCVCFNGGTTTQTTAAGASTTYTVQTTVAGQYLALVMPKAANRGRATLTVDGAATGSVDTYAATAQNRIIVWQTKLGAAGVHTIKVTNQATAGRSRIDIDAVLMSKPFN